MSDTTVIDPPQEGETETRARRLGWVPKEDFRGDPDKWRPAEEFLDRGERILPILQRDNDKLHRRLSEVETMLKETREASKELLEFTSKSEQRAYERAKSEIEARIEQAAANADANAVRSEMRNLDDLNKQHQPKAETKTEQRREAPQPQIDPEIQTWIDHEPWFNKDRALNAYAIDTYGELERARPGMTTAERLAETKRRTMDKFPEKFGVNPDRERPSTVSTPNSGGTSRKKGKTYDDLPADAKKACDKFVRTIPGYTREQYVKDYSWED